MADSSDELMDNRLSFIPIPRRFNNAAESTKPTAILIPSKVPLASPILSAKSPKFVNSALKSPAVITPIAMESPPEEIGSIDETLYKGAVEISTGKAPEHRIVIEEAVAESVIASPAVELHIQTLALEIQELKEQEDKLSKQYEEIRKKEIKLEKEERTLKSLVELLEQHKEKRMSLMQRFSRLIEPQPASIRKSLTVKVGLPVVEAPTFIAKTPVVVKSETPVSYAFQGHLSKLGGNSLWQYRKVEVKNGHFILYAPQAYRLPERLQTMTEDEIRMDSYFVAKLIQLKVKREDCEFVLLTKSKFYLPKWIIPISTVKSVKIFAKDEAGDDGHWLNIRKFIEKPDAFEDESFGKICDAVYKRTFSLITQERAYVLKANNNALLWEWLLVICKIWRSSVTN